jgi:hypothetical protein
MGIMDEALRRHAILSALSRQGIRVHDTSPVYRSLPALESILAAVVSELS